MWFPGKVALIGVLAFLIFQNSTEQPAMQNAAPSRAAPANQQQSAKSAGATSSVGAAQAVITVRGLCETGSKSCTKIMTREQFENLAESLNVGGSVVPPRARRNLAQTYTEYLAVEAAARKAGMEDTPQFEELMNWVRLRAITDLYRRSLEEKLRNPGQDEIHAYYKDHQSDYEQASLARIVIPRDNPLAPDKDQFDTRALEAAKGARERAQKGEDPAQVQKDVYSALGLNGPPITDLGKRRRADLVPEEAAEVFSLDPGGVSRVETEARNYVIYKIVGKNALPEEEVKSEIAKEIYQRKFRDAMKAVIDAAPAELNEQYFGPTAPVKAQ